MQIELRREAKHIAKQYKERNRQSMLNVLSDSTTATLIFCILLRKTEGRAHFFRTLARFASGLSDTAKAFLIIAGKFPSHPLTKVLLPFTDLLVSTVGRKSIPALPRLC